MHPMLAALDQVDADPQMRAEWEAAWEASLGSAHEPLACVGEHFPASWERAPSWFGPTDAASYAPIHRAIAARPRPVGLVTLEVR